MSTRVKVGVAALIVGALIALIVVDRSTSNTGSVVTTRDEVSIFHDDSIVEEAGIEILDVSGPAGSGRGETVILDIDNIGGSLEAYQRRIGNLAAPDLEPAPAIKGRTEPLQPIQDIKSTPPTREVESPAGEQYVVQPGDSYYVIAEKKYGDGSLWKTIAGANPDMKPYALRVGKKIMIPPKPVKAETAAAPADAVVQEGGGKFYVVQPRDTLTGISQKLFRTIKYASQIYDLNRTVLADPDALSVGMKLALPEVAAQPEAPKPVEQKVEIPAGAQVHKVESGENLWKIAEKYAGNRGLLEMIELIVKANPDRLPSKTTVLRIGWSLIIPQ